MAATIRTETAQVRVTLDGTRPTWLDGRVMEVGAPPLELSGRRCLTGFQAVATGPTIAVLDVEYFSADY